MHIGKLITVLCMLMKPTVTRDVDNKKLLIRDFVKVMPMPLRVIAFLCWRKDDLSGLSKLLSLNFIQHNIFCTTFPKMSSYRNSDSLLIVTEVQCEKSLSFLLEAKNNFFMDFQHHWLTFSSNTENALDNLRLNVNSQFYLVNFQNFGEYLISEYYKYHPKDPTSNAEFISIWRSQTGFSDEKKLSNVVHKHNLMGTKLPVSIVVSDKDKWNDLWNFRDTDVDGFSKHHFMLIEILMDFLNATRFYRGQKLWGYRDKSTGYHSGVFGDLERGFSELAGIAGFILDSRVEIADFLPITTKTDYTFIYRAPRLSYTKNIYLLLFDEYILYCCGVMVLVVYFILYLTMNFEWVTRNHRPKISKDVVPKPKAMEVALLCTEAATLQSVEVEPKFYSGRIVLIVYLFSILFLNTSYSALIINILQSSSDQDLTIKDLLKTDIKLGAEDVSYNYYFFENLDDPIKQKIYKQEIAENFMDINKGIEKVRDEFFAFHGFAIDYYRVINDIFPEHKRCGLKLLNFLSLSADTAFSVKKNSTYKEIIKLGFMKIYESGIKWRSYYRIFGEKPKCESSQKAFISIGLIDCYYLFTWLASGIVSSLVILLMEIGVRRYFKKRQFFSWRYQLYKIVPYPLNIQCVTQ